MPKVKLNPDGSITVVKDQAEIVAYYDKLISRRTEALVKLMALGGDIEPVKKRITQLSSEKKQKLMEAQSHAEN
ncbi:hypothetical protein [Anaerospora sp.]|uniref:hypothetical protein n=1 Tax=Anaerospora sp. TaxID=1960278 RepID=UPI00289639A4|nr:hypothetical protein [Anaerospora sp.]